MSLYVWTLKAVVLPATKTQQSVLHQLELTGFILCNKAKSWTSYARNCKSCSPSRSREKIRTSFNWPQICLLYEIKSLTLWRLLLQDRFRKRYQTQNHHRWHWDRSAIPKGVWLAVRGWCVGRHPPVTLNATCTAWFWPDSAENKTSRNHPPFFLMGQVSFLLMPFHGTHQPKLWQQISNKWGSINTVAHVGSFSGSTDLSTCYQGPSSLAPCFYVHPLNTTGVCAKKKQRSEGSTS